MDRIVREAKLGPIRTTWTERDGFCLSAHNGSTSCAPSRNLRNMIPDLQHYAGQCMFGSLAMRLLGQCLLGSSPPHMLLYQLYRTFPFHLYWFPMWPTLPLFLFLYGWEFSTAGSVCSHLLTLPWIWRPYVPPKCSSHKVYMAPYPRRQHSSVTAMKTSNLISTKSLI
jgi:hypothetical protein